MKLKRIHYVAVSLALGAVLMMLGLTPTHPTPAAAQTTANRYEVILLLNQGARPQDVWQWLSQQESVSHIQGIGADQIRLTTEGSEISSLQTIPGVARVIKLAPAADLLARSFNQLPPTPTPATFPTKTPTVLCNPECGFPTPTPTPFCDPRVDGCGFPTPFPTGTLSPDQVGRITGTITDAVTGLPVAGISVCAKPAYWYPLPPTDGATPTPTPTPLVVKPTQNDESMWGGCATTAADGAYEINSLPAHSYVVSANDPTGNYLWQFYNPNNLPEKYTPVSVTATQTTPNINFALNKAGHITGQVVDSKNQPVAGIQVTANRYHHDGGWLEWVGSSTTDTHGRYDLGNLSPDQYVVGFIEMGNYGGVSIYYENASQPNQAKPVQVLAGQTTPNINVKLSNGGSISGQVTNNEGQPLANIAVSLYRQRSGFWEIFKEIQTDTQGQYKLGGLSQGVYVVQFQEYPKDSQKPIYIPEYYNNAPTLEQATSITLNADQTLENVNAVLEKGGVITGSVTDAQNRPVVGPDGSMLTWTAITVYQKQGQDWVWYGHVYADNQSGAYQVTGLPSGTYRVSASGWLNNYYFQVYYPNANTLEQATDIQVKSGETVPNINMVVQDPNGHITGKVTGLNGQGVPNVYVEVNRLLEGRWVGSGKGITQNDGSYDIAHLTTGSYRLGFYDWSGQYMTTYYKNASSLDNATDIFVTTGQTTAGIDVVMSSGGVVTGKVTNKAGQPVAKMEVCALPVYMPVPLPDKTPTPGSPLPPTPTPDIKPRQMMTPTPTPTPNGTSLPFPGDMLGRCGYTQENGVYTVTHLATGSYILQFYGQDIYLGEYYDDANSWEEADPVAVIVGQTTNNINAVLSSGGAIAGTVIDSQTQKPLQNIVVCSQGVWGGRCVATDPQGQYLLNSLTPGSYLVSFQDPIGNYLHQYYNQTPVYEEADSIQVVAEETIQNINAAMSPGGIITGKVQDVTGQPIARVMVSAWVSQTRPIDDKYYGEFWGVTNEQGEYELKGLATGSYYVRFHGAKSGYNLPPYPGDNYNMSQYVDEFYNNAATLDQATRVPVTLSQTTSNIDAVLEKGGEIQGKLSNGQNQPIGWVLVEAYQQVNQTWQVVKSTYSDYQGNYLLSGLTTGQYRLHFVGSYYGPMAQQQTQAPYANEYYDNATSLDKATDIQVTLGQTTANINATLGHGGSITGQVTDKTGKPIIGVGVEVYRQRGEGPGVAGSAFTNEAGLYEVSGLAEGSYLLRFWDSQKRYAYEFYNDVADLTAATPVQVKPDETTGNINAQLSDAMSPLAEIKGANSQVSYDTRGLATINQTSTQPADLTVEMPATMCTGTATNVTLHMNTLTYAMQPASNGLYQATIPASQLIHGATLTVSATCNNTTIQQRIGQFLFTDQATPAPGDNTIKKVYLPLMMR